MSRSLHSSTVVGPVIACWDVAIPVLYDHPKAGPQVVLLQPHASSLAGLFHRVRSGDIVVASGLIWLMPRNSHKGGNQLQPALAMTCYRLILTGGRVQVPVKGLELINGMRRVSNGAKS